MRLLPLLLLLAAAAHATDAADMPDVEASAVYTKEDALAEKTARRLSSDPDARGALAGRILGSSLGPALSVSEDPAEAFREVLSWIEKRPEDASHLAIGFAGDDARGDHRFEESLYRRVVRRFELNPNRSQGILGRLDGAASESKGLADVAEMDDEERRDLIRRFFEGRSTSSGKVGDTPQDERAQGGSPPGPGKNGPSTYAGEGLYDRLSAANPTGYSPEVQALQNAMNRGRPPGAPRLSETGRLDYATLRYPYYGLRYDQRRLAKRMKAQRAWFQARQLGKEREFTAAQLGDPAVQKALDEKAGGGKADAAVRGRMRVLARLDAAIRDFDREASRTRRASGITRERLTSLSLKRLRAARQIAAAALDEKLFQLSSYKGFLTQPLEEAVRKAPADEETRGRYLESGKRLNAELLRAIEDGRKAASLLAKDDDASLQAAQPAVSRINRLSKSLPVRIEAYKAAPYRLAAAKKTVPSWRAWLDGWIVKLLPDSSRAKLVRREQEKEKKALAAFIRIAGSR